MSPLPSPFRSPIATADGLPPVPNSRLARNRPSPLLMSTETLLLGDPFALTRSGLPSRVRSPIATAAGSFPVAYDVARANVGPFVSRHPAPPAESARIESTARVRAALTTV